MSVRERVIKARQIAEKRFKNHSGIWCNAQMASAHLRDYCQLDDSSRTLLENAIKKLALSARAMDRILKVARTIADLQAQEQIQSHHIAEAIGYRTIDRSS